MFYLTKRIDENQCTVGERCMVLADFSGIEAGTIGKVVNVDDRGGITIEFYPKCNESGGCLCSGCNGTRKNPRDRFTRDELEYLAFETEKHPKVDPKVSRE